MDSDLAVSTPRLGSVNTTAHSNPQVQPITASQTQQTPNNGPQTLPAQVTPRLQQRPTPPQMQQQQLVVLSGQQGRSSQSNAGHGSRVSHIGHGQRHGHVQQQQPQQQAVREPLQQDVQVTVTGTGASPSQELWDRLDVLFQSIRGNARGGYDYPGASVVALETVLIRLYVEGPMRGSGSSSSSI